MVLIAAAFLEAFVPAHHAAVGVKHVKRSRQTLDCRVREFFFLGEFRFGGLADRDLVFQQLLNLHEFARQMLDALVCFTAFTGWIWRGHIRLGLLRSAAFAARLGASLQSRAEQPRQITQGFAIQYGQLARSGIEHRQHAEQLARLGKNRYACVKTNMRRANHQRMIAYALVCQRIRNDENPGANR